MENVLCDVQVPIDNAVKLRDRLARLRAVVDKDLISTEKKLRAGATDAIPLREKIISKQRLLSSTNLLRLAVIVGTEAVLDMKDEALVKRLTETGLRRGPRTKADAA